MIFIFRLGRVSLSLLLLPSGYCEETHVVIICGDPFRGFPHLAPATFYYLLVVLPTTSFLATFTVTFFCWQLPILKELKTCVCTWSLAVHTSSRVKSLYVIQGSVKLCYSVWFNISCNDLPYGCLVTKGGIMLGH